MIDGLSEIVNAIPLISETVEYWKTTYNDSKFFQDLIIYSIPSAFIFINWNLVKLSDRNRFSVRRNLFLPPRYEDADSE